MNMKEAKKEIDKLGVSLGVMTKEQLYSTLKNLAEHAEVSEELIVQLRERYDGLKKFYDENEATLNESIALQRETIELLKEIVEMRDITIKQLQDNILQLEQKEKEKDKGFLDRVPWYVYPIAGSVVGNILYQIFK